MNPVRYARTLVSIFTEEELSSIRRDYDFKERLKDSSVSSNSSIFTVHNLDTEANEELSKSIVMAPYNTNESGCEDFVEVPVVSKRVIKFSSKLREVNREYERDNNSNIDNGIYLKSANAKPHRVHCKRNSVMKIVGGQIKKEVLSEMEKMGFERKFVIGSVNANSHNSATTCYYLLSQS